MEGSRLVEIISYELPRAMLLLPEETSIVIG
jgi:hypothetical protein